MTFVAAHRGASEEAIGTAVAAYLVANPPSGTPTGTIVCFGDTTPPAGFLACDGAAVSRATYSALFGVIGETWGAGDGTTTFNVPDFRNRMPIGSGDTYSLNGAGGAATVTLTAAQSGLPQHTHTQDSHNHTQDAHTHTQNSHNHTQDAHTHTQNAHTHDFLPRSATSGSVSSIVTGTLDTSSTISGSNQPHVQNATATNQNATATNQAATATNQNATATNQAATATNQNAGPSNAAEAHENLPPYRAVPFCIKT